ncbi:hypothetical protein NIES22_21370 [Calothrix brevissima NIES-22]|nr:hypothetical protein NIES22_21370 [Calothrix brevissima NIES-22]
MLKQQYLQSDIHESSPLITPLASGEKLSRYEFERRYQTMPKHKKAELIEGVVYLESPLSFLNHLEPQSNLIDWLWNYRIATPGIKLGTEPKVRLDQDNEPQPDAVLFIDNNLGGNSQLTADSYIEGAPELVVEIAANSEDYYLSDKENVYRRNGIQEYIVWYYLENKLNWFQLIQGEYIPLKPNEDGILCSQVMPGLWLAISALIAGNMSHVMAALKAGLNSPEYTEFVTRLLANIM